MGTIISVLGLSSTVLVSFLEPLIGCVFNILVIFYPLIVAAGFLLKDSIKVIYFKCFWVVVLAYLILSVVFHNLYVSNYAWNWQICYSVNWRCKTNTNKCPDSVGNSDSMIMWCWDDTVVDYECYKVNDYAERCSVDEQTLELFIIGCIISILYNFIFVIPLCICVSIIVCRVQTQINYDKI